MQEGEHAKLPTVVFKTAIRKRLEEAGYKILLNIGDQPSDLEGGYAERTVEIPNYLYSSKTLPNLFQDSSRKNTYSRIPDQANVSTMKR